MTSTPHATGGVDFLQARAARIAPDAFRTFAKVTVHTVKAWTRQHGLAAVPSTWEREAATMRRCMTLLPDEPVDDLEAQLSVANPVALLAKMYHLRPAVVRDVMKGASAHLVEAVATTDPGGSPLEFSRVPKERAALLHAVRQWAEKEYRWTKVVAPGLPSTFWKSLALVSPVELLARKLAQHPEEVPVDDGAGGVAFRVDVLGVMYRQIAAALKRGERKTRHRACSFCDRPFTPARSDAVYCSSACKVKAWREGRG